MKRLLFSFVLLLAGAWLFGRQDEAVRILVFGLAFGAMVGAMCTFSVAWRLGVQAERNTQRVIKDYRNGVGPVRPYIEA